jgi:hypothetical protein
MRSLIPQPPSELASIIVKRPLIEIDNLHGLIFMFWLRVITHAEHCVQIMRFH